MKKLTKDEIISKFKGVYTAKELREIAKMMDEVANGTPEERELKRIRDLDIKGFKAKDIKVQWYLERGEDVRYSFFIMKNGKDWSFYYGGHERGAKGWWPEPENDRYLSPITEFIPRGFSEMCENTYEYHGKKEDAIGLLTKCGFTVEKGEDC